MAKTHTGEPDSASVQPTEVLSGLEAVARTERVICRGAVTREPAVAEGLALAGVRAASLADAATAGVAGTVALPGASCVHHVSGAGHHAHAGAFELAARSVQEAADHCLAAHLLSQKLGRAGACSLAPALAERLDVVALPGAALAGALLDSGTQEAEPDAGPERILELARTALQAASERTGRRADLVEYRGDDGAELVLVASGADGDRGRGGRADSLAGRSRGRRPLAGAGAPVSDERGPGRPGRRPEACSCWASRRSGPRSWHRCAQRPVSRARSSRSRPALPAQLLEALAARLPKGAFDAEATRARDGRALSPPGAGARRPLGRADGAPGRRGARAAGPAAARAAHAPRGGSHGPGLGRRSRPAGPGRSAAGRRALAARPGRRPGPDPAGRYGARRVRRGHPGAAGAGPEPGVAERDPGAGAHGSLGGPAGGG